MAFLTIATGDSDPTDSILKMYRSFFLPILMKFLRVFISSASAVFLHYPQ